MDTLLDKEKADHESAVTKKRGRPKQKEEPNETHRTLRCRYRSHVRTYYLEFTIDETLSGVEVRSVTASAQREGVDLAMMIQLLGTVRIKNVIRKHMISEKIITPLAVVSFHESTLLK